MSAKIQPVIAVLFDHELRAAAAALRALQNTTDATPDELAALIRKALNLALLALHAVRDHVQAITVIDVRDTCPTGTPYDAAAEAPATKTAQENA